MTTVQSEPQGKGPSSMALGDREGFPGKWRGVGIFTLESGLGWTDGAKGRFCAWCRGDSVCWKGVTDSGMVFWVGQG